MSEPLEPQKTTNQNAETKPGYEPPKMILLNKITLGHGVCTKGASDTDTCFSGGSASTSCETGYGRK